MTKPEVANNKKAAKRPEVTETLSDGRKMTIKERLGQGTFSTYYKVEINDERYFLKLFSSSSKCSGATSKSVLKNDIVVQEYLLNRNPNSFYRGHIEIDGVLCELFKYVEENEGKTLATVIDVEDNFDPALSSTEKKKAVIAKQIDVLTLEQVVYISSQISLQANSYHGCSHHGRAGIIHADISPQNVMLYTVNKDGKRKREALLQDFGISREKDSDNPRKLFNQTTPGKVSGNYYNSETGFLANSIYSPPNLTTDYISKITTSYDTYCLTNLLCLMLTSRLIEHWRNGSSEKDRSEKGKTENNNAEKDVSKARGISEETLANCIGLIIQSKREGYTEQQYTGLAQIIVKGTSPDVTKRYCPQKQ